MPTLVNRFVPPGYLGLRDGPGVRTDPYDYVLDFVLTALQSTQFQKSLDTDSDFLWEAIVVSSATSTFNVQFTDSRRYTISDAQMPSTIYTGTDPYALGVPLVEPAGGRIIAAVTDTSGSTNTIQIVFRGAKRYLNT